MIRALVFIALTAAASCLPPEEDASQDPLIGSSAVEASRASCEAEGGRFAAGGMVGTLVCYRTPPDAGKACSSAGDCSTDCLARTKTCAPIDPLFGCHDILDSHGRLVRLCRD